MASSHEGVGDCDEGVEPEEETAAAAAGAAAAVPLAPPPPVLLPPGTDAHDANGAVSGPYASSTRW